MKSHHYAFTQYLVIDVLNQLSALCRGALFGRSVSENVQKIAILHDLIDTDE